MIYNFQSVNFKVDNKLKFFVKNKTKKLEKFYKRILKIRVLFKIENTSSKINKIVEFIVRIPGREIVVKNTTFSFEKSVNISIKKAERILVKLKKK